MMLFFYLPSSQWPSHFPRHRRCFSLNSLCLLHALINQVILLLNRGGRGWGLLLAILPSFVAQPPWISITFRATSLSYLFISWLKYKASLIVEFFVSFFLFLTNKKQKQRKEEMNLDPLLVLPWCRTKVVRSCGGFLKRE